MLSLHPASDETHFKIAAQGLQAYQVVESSLPCAANVHAWSLPYRIQAF